MMLKALLLQTPLILLDGQQVSFPVKRAEALLYYMLVRKTASRQELISLLWEDCDEAAGLKNLRNTLYSLKKVLGGEFLLSPRKSLLVVNESWETDCDYDHLVRERIIPENAGEFLQGFSLKRAFAFEEWVRSVREKTREIFLGELIRRAEEAEREDPREAARLCREYLREDPYHEGMTCLLMRCCSAGGEYEKAARVFQQLKKLLQEELGILPQESTTALYYSIMNRWNEASNSGADPERPVLPAGRERILEILVAAREALARSDLDRSACLLTGEAGSGKSELIQSFLGWTDLSGMYVVRTDCLQSEEQFPLLPWKRLTRQLWDLAADEGLALPIRTQAELGEMEESGGAFRKETLQILLRELLRKRRILLILENIQWLDTAGGTLLEHLLYSAELKGIMAVLSCRDDYKFGIRKILEGMERKGVLLRLKLQPLNGEEIRFLIARELGDEKAAEYSERFLRESGGNLVLLEELIRKSKDRTPEELSEPGKLLGEEISSLPENALRIAKLLSLFPEQLSGSVLLKLSGGDDRMLTGGVDVLRRKGLIEEHHGGKDDFYRFRHSRIRELVYEMTPAREKRTAYAHMASILEKEGNPGDSRDLRETAQCFELAKMPDKALPYRAAALSLECSRAFVPFSWYGGGELKIPDREEIRQEAEALFRQLDELRGQGMEEAAAVHTECLVLEAAGTEAATRGDMKQGNELLGRISGLEDRGRRFLRVRICYLLSQLAVYRQNPDLAEHYVSAGMRSLTDIGDPLRTAAFQRLRGCCFCLRQSYDKAAYYHLEAVDLLEKQPQTTEVKLQLAAAYADLARVYRHKNGYAEASACFKKALSLADGENWPGLTWVYVHYGRTVFALEDHRKARELFRTALDISGKNGELPGRGAAAAYLAYYAAEDCDSAAAEKYLSEAEECCGKMGSPLEQGILSFVSMTMRQKAELEGRTEGTGTGLLKETAEQYARKGLRHLSGIPDVFEAELIRRALRQGISAKTSFRANELDRKTKHFMTE